MFELRLQQKKPGLDKVSRCREAGGAGVARDGEEAVQGESGALA